MAATVMASLMDLADSEDSEDSEDSVRMHSGVPEMKVVA